MPRTRARDSLVTTALELMTWTDDILFKLLYALKNFRHRLVDPLALTFTWSTSGEAEK